MHETIKMPPALLSGADMSDSAIAVPPEPETAHIDQPKSSILPDLLADATTPAQDELTAARAIIERTIESVKDDPTAHLCNEVTEAFRTIRTQAPLEYEAARTKMKQAHTLVRMAALDTFSRGDVEASSERVSAATKLAELAANHCELWHDPEGNAFASFERPHDGISHREHWRIDSTGFREWMGWLAYSEMGDAPSSETIKAASNTLSGKAKFDGEEHEPALRVAKNGAGYWLDLCDEHWRAILITATGWQIVDRPLVRFTRNKAMRSLPLPVAPGHIEALWELVNIPQEDRPLVLAWQLESLRPDTPYPVLELIGEQGSAKSTTQETLRRFLDPNQVMLRGRPKGVEDVFVAAGSNHVISLENLSGLSPELSDALCTISTGGGQAGRLLFTNGEEHIIEAHNPIMLNGIGAVVTRPDLLDRTIAVCVPVITQRLTEAEHAEALERKAPAIMAGLLDLFAQTLATLPEVMIAPAERPRMADFAELGEAMHRAKGSVAGEWLKQYVSHRKDAIRRTIDASPVAQACIELVEQGRHYSGTVNGLLETLNRLNAANNTERGDYWPRTPKGLGDALRRVAPALRQIGIYLSVDAKPKRDGVHCVLRAASPSLPSTRQDMEGQSSPSSQPPYEREVVKV
ncbi:hypothetical protein [Niveibacterium sp.]|uniref:hypothetical protein n=1 Tax=Niveibacterium sp. TaxID=2017444 RepID=UPI0035B0C92D